MRVGSVYRRCTKCRVRLRKGQRVCKCGHTKVTWAFRINLGATGELRRLKWGYGFETRDAAQAALDRLRNAKATHTYVEPSRLTLASYLDQWMESDHDWSANARRDYTWSITKYIKPGLGDVTLQALATAHISAFYGRLVRPRGQLSRKSVHNIEICLRSALSQAVRHKLINTNPASGAFDYSHTRNRQEMKVWNADQVSAFLRFTSEGEDAALYQVALGTGMRRGEVLGLRRGDLDLANARLQVRQQYTRNGSKLELVGLKNDSRGWRTIEVAPAVVAALQAHLDRQAAQQVVPLHRHDALVFANAIGQPMDPDVVRRRFDRRVGQANLPKIRFHDLRHTHATFLLQEGLPIHYVAQRLGDSVETVMSTYAHVTPAMGGAAVAALARLG